MIIGHILDEPAAEFNHSGYVQMQQNGDTGVC